MSEVVDWSVALAQIPGGADGVRQLAAAMAEEAAKLIDGIDDALARGVAEEAQRHAHTLKSGVLYFGAEEVAAAARDVEDRARDGRLDEAREASSPLRALVERLRQDLADVERGLGEQEPE